MIRQRLNGRLPLIVTTVSCVVVGALIVTLAVVSGGYKAQHLDLGDTAVWVTNRGQQLLGRANTEIKRLNTVVAAESPLVEVIQDGESVFALDRTSNVLGIIDPATATVTESVPLPPREPTVEAAAGRVVVAAATGEVWLAQEAALAAFDANSPATLDLGVGASTALTGAGTLFAYSPEAGRLYRVDPSSTGPVSATIEVTAGDAPVVTTAGEEWALYDRSGSRVVTEGGTVSLAGTPAEGTGALVQLPGDEAESVYLASSTGLVAVPLDGSAPRVLVDETLGTPTRPVVVGDCVFAAWASGRTFTQCGSAPSETGVLQGLRPGAELEFHRGGNRLVLNDAMGGTVWAVQDGNRLIDNWDELKPENPDETTTVEDDRSTPPDFEKTQQAPVAVDDELGARPGRASVLPVLLNDYDVNGDVLVIDSVTPIAASTGTVGIINQGQQVQLTLTRQAAGAVSFDYTISDGKGGTATATVTVSVRADSENSPPRQVRPARATVQQGARVTTQVLADWFDPDGDAFYLAAAIPATPDTASYTPQGTVVFSDGGSGGDSRDVGLVVSDARSEGSGVLAVAVRAAGKVPVVADPFVVQVQAGQEVTVKPLDHARGGSAPLRLSAVPAKAESTVVPDFDGGTFSFVSTAVRSHYLEYAVTDGITSATGTIRVVVTAPTGANAKPVTVPHTAFVREQGTQEIDVLAKDFDPAGGVLLVTAVTSVPSVSGLRVEILGQHLLRVTLTRPLEEPVVFGYRVSNGLSEADGTVTVIQLPPPAVRQPPIAQPDTTSVRVGDVIDIPVLDNDTQPDGDELTLDPTLATPLPKDGGLLFASQNVLRYLAPDTPGNYTAAYRVTGADGQWATATVTISVRELDRSVNAPPVPKNVTARVFAGETVRIPIPLRGIDPDGDSVTLLGQRSNPQKGAVIRIESGWIEYQAGEYSTGTDSFQYQVVDALGARATGTVRVGIAGHEQTGRNPVAVADEVMTRPGATVSVRVLDNDSDPDGGILTITSVVPSGNSAKARVADGVVRVTAPEAEGRYGFIYEIQNESGGTSSNFLTVVVSKNAPLARPVATDAVLRLSDILDRDHVDVDVLSGVFFADGPASSLLLSVLPGYDDTATVTERGTVRVEVRPQRQIIPFAVANPKDSAITGMAFIHVPGSDDALPQLRRSAPVLRIASEKTLRIELDDYIVAVAGKKVRLTDASKVSASHASGDSLVVDDDTLQFTSADRYFGPASISFEVTDGASTSDPEGRLATIVLPITVTPRENQPPVFSGGQLELEPGARRTIDLVKLTRYPYAKDQGELEFQILEPRPAGIAVSIDSQKMTLSVDESTPKGTKTSVLVGVRDAINEGKAGRIDLEVVPSTRPLAIPQADAAIAPRGTTTTVDVLANDGAANPFPDTPLRVIGVRGTDAASLPDGVSVIPSPDRSRLTVTVASDAVPGDSMVQYQVADATDDPSRYVWGQVRISVQDKPDPVGNLRVSGFADRRLTLGWDPGPANNSPITEFQVTMSQPGAGVISVTSCESTSCELRTPGNGPENGVRLTVQARNGIGLSDPASFSGAVWSDVLPNAPVDLSAAPLDHGLRVSWRKPDNAPGATAIHSYLVAIGGVVREVGAPGVQRGDGVGTRYTVDITDPGIANGASVTYSVASRNDFYGGADWKSADGVGVPAGPPLPVATPSAVPTTDGSGRVTIAWDGVFDANGRAITTFHAVGYHGSPPVCNSSTGALGGGGVSATTDGSARSATLTVPTTREAWNFLVYAFNGQGCAASSPVSAVPLSKPVAPQAVAVQLATGGQNDSGIYLPVFQSASPAPSPAPGGTAGYEYRFVRQRGTGFDSDPAPITPGQAFVVAPQHLGKTALVQVRVVERYAGGVVLYSDWSAATNAGVAVDARADVVPQSEAQPRRFSWTGTPRGDYAAVEYACGSGDYQAMRFSWGSCDVPDGQPLELRVRVTANDGQYYVMMYRR